MTERRAYHSPIRKRQAEQSRQLILDAARARMLANGYAAATIEQIAAAAGLAPQTVRATFGGKPRLLAAVVERAAYGMRYESVVDDPDHARVGVGVGVGVGAAITGLIYELLDAELRLLRVSALTDPDPAEIEQVFPPAAANGKAPLIEHLVPAGNCVPA